MKAAVRPFHPADGPGVLALILSIQRQEFGIPITAEDQPDLAAIPAFYQCGAGQFWVAERHGVVVGTIGLKDIGGRAAALRKMFVGPEARGQAGVASALLAAALDHARAFRLADVWLGTTDRFQAAHRFYEKNGFHRIQVSDLPEAFPRMAVDTVFYRLAL
ncbi:MAG: GNAT family N-acetyltransferase [Caulobacter sp.]|nr:GNAT family N-acetyltransferase [Caulobacter sp.]